LAKSRAFEAARNSRLNFGWTNISTDINIELAYSLNVLKFRARDLVQNSTLLNAYSCLMVKNVIGSEGFTFKNLAVNPDGKPDVVANTIIERNWNSFCDNPTVSKNMTMKDALRLAVQSLSVDGECILVMHEGYDNDFKFGIEIVDSLNLDPGLNMVLPNGNKIICGVEFNEYRVPQNYYFRAPYSVAMEPNTYTKVPANRVRHLFNRKILGAVRGFPPVTPIMEDLKTLDGYIESELVAARTGAAKMGFIEQDGTVPYTGDDVDENGNQISDIEPGHIEILNKGQKFVGFSPMHPNTAFADFVKSLQKQIAGALDISYNSLVSDYEATSYSSLRAASLSDRETYKQIQEMLTENFLYPVFEKWLTIQIINKNVNLPFYNFSKFNQPTFHAKMGKWVDPQKEIEAAKIALEIGTTSRTRIMAEQGIAFADVLNEREAEDKALKEAGILTIFALNQPENPDSVSQSETGKKPNSNSGVNGA